MTDTIIELSEEEFDTQYPLRTNHLNPAASWAYGEGGGCLFETYGEELAFVREQDPRTVWTFIDGDEGDQYVLSGFHLVNRIGYLISTVPVPERTTIQVRIPIQSEEDAVAKSYTPEPWYVSTLADNTPVVQSVSLEEDNFICQVEGRDTGEAHANARRICTTVNACKGIGTEALERGIVADLRHILGELLTAASDLDAAIDGVTDQFDAERNRLNAALHAAQSVLDSSMALDLHELLAHRGQIALIWSMEDVQEIRPELSDEQACEVLDRVERKHDATLGVTWDTLEWTAEDLFGDAPETDSQDD